MFKKYFLNDIFNLSLEIKPGDIIFIYGDLASGKTTFSKHIINNLLGIKQDVISPTYTYYNKYGKNIYHFDLYRLNNYDEFFAIGGEEILDNSENISIIEWPEIIKPYFKPNIEIYLRKTKNELEREIGIVYN
ncbi:MAG: tRNA (adenosine(37)-N6)-threonylcarbamoyltransferase complex ATPase subunit type 1 TsaE [Candidatus Gracilibacteria bacterium]|nr:tRNA (adenosine(37)-N6)-threonylcarbamoyltransferase complex ATPase subunit type 1 TsaE [Candidatus Gracilibacteria bacterium]